MSDFAIPGAAQLDETEARDITNKIRQNLGVAMVHIRKAWLGRAWVAMGYDTWTDYCECEFEEYIKLDRNARQELVFELRAIGMSTRAIGTAIGVSVGTVHADLTAGVQNRTPDVTPVTPTIIGNDGKSYPVSAPTPTPVQADEDDDWFYGERPSTPAQPPAIREVRLPAPEVDDREEWDWVHTPPPSWYAAEAQRKADLAAKDVKALAEHRATKASMTPVEPHQAAEIIEATRLLDEASRILARYGPEAVRWSLMQLPIEQRRDGFETLRRTRDRLRDMT